MEREAITMTTLSLVLPQVFARKLTLGELLEAAGIPTYPITAVAAYQRGAVLANRRRAGFWGRFSLVPRLAATLLPFVFLDGFGGIVAFLLLALAYPSFTLVACILLFYAAAAVADNLINSRQSAFGTASSRWVSTPFAQFTKISTPRTAIVTA
jgi:hypothetical protein